MQFTSLVSQSSVHLIHVSHAASHSLIVPYAISGSYKFRGKDLVLRIGEPFSVDDDLEKSNEKLDYAIKDLLKENEKNSGK